jgi:CheY-like chemotaxis protein
MIHMPEQAATHPANKGELRLLVIDDDEEWRSILSDIAEDLGHTADTAATLEEARTKLRRADARQRRYDIALIDMNFEIGKQNTQMPRGKEVVQYIKTHYPAMACIMVSGSLNITPERVLDLRDDYDLDYYIQKERFEIDTFVRALERALARVRVMPPPSVIETAPPAPEPSPPEPPPLPPVPTLETAPLQITLDFQTYQGTTSIVWRSALIGRESTELHVPYSEHELPLVIKALDVMQYPNYPEPASAAERQYFAFSADEQYVLAGLGIWDGQRVSRQVAQVVGQRLYQALGPQGQTILKTLRNTSITQRASARYILRFPRSDIHMAALPWELLWDAENNQAVLIRGSQIDSCERYVDIDFALPPPLPVGQKPRLLALLPRYGIPSTIRAEERAARLATWKTLQDAGQIVYTELGGEHPLTMASLNDSLLAHDPQRFDIIHYFGHGIYQDGKGYLLFDDGQGGAQRVSVEKLAAVLGDIRLIVIHACQSATLSQEGSLLTGIAPALSVVSGAVVAMQLTVSVPAATRFAGVFYDQLLGKKRSLQDAVARSRQVLFAETLDDTNWYVPTLYIRSRQPQEIYFVQ